MKFKIYLILVCLLLISCKKQQQSIELNKYYCLLQVDSSVININTYLPSNVHYNDGKIIVSNLKPHFISIYNYSGELKCIFSKEGEGPGEGYLTQKNSLYIVEDTIFILFTNPQKISKFTKNGIFIEDVKINECLIFNFSQLSKSLLVFSKLSTNYTQYLLYNIHSQKIESLFTFQSNHPNSNYQNFIDNNPHWKNQLFFSTNESLIYIVDKYDDKISIYDINGKLKNIKDLEIENWNPVPFFKKKDLINSKNFVIRPFSMPAIYPPIFYDSLVIIRVKDFYRNNWNDLLNNLDSFGYCDFLIDTIFNDYLYIYDDEINLIDILKLNNDFISNITFEEDTLIVFSVYISDSISQLTIYKYLIKTKNNSFLI